MVDASLTGARPAKALLDPLLAPPSEDNKVDRIRRNKRSGGLLLRPISRLAIVAGLAGPMAFHVSAAVLRKSVHCRASPIPGQTYPTTFVTGMPRAV